MRFSCLIFALTWAFIGCQKQPKQPTGQTLTPEQTAEPTAPVAETPPLEPASEPQMPLSTEDYQDNMPSQDNLKVMEDETSAPPTAAPISHLGATNSPGSLYKQAIAAVENKDWQKARALYLKSCEQGNWLGCHRYAWHQQGLGNLNGATPFYKKACDHGIAKSCNNLGWIQEHLQDNAQAKHFYAQGCIHNSAKACAHLKRLKHDGSHNNTTKNTKMAH